MQENRFRITPSRNGNMLWDLRHDAAPLFASKQKFAVNTYGDVGWCGNLRQVAQETRARMQSCILFTLHGKWVLWTRWIKHIQDGALCHCFSIRMPSMAAMNETQKVEKLANSFWQSEAVRGVQITATLLIFLVGDGSPLFTNISSVYAGWARVFFFFFQAIRYESRQQGRQVVCLDGSEVPILLGFLTRLYENQRNN